MDKLSSAETVDGTLVASLLMCRFAAAWMFCSLHFLLTQMEEMQERNRFLFLENNLFWTLGVRQLKSLSVWWCVYFPKLRSFAFNPFSPLQFSSLTWLSLVYLPCRNATHIFNTHIFKYLWLGRVREKHIWRAEEALFLSFQWLLLLHRRHDFCS